MEWTLSKRRELSFSFLEVSAVFIGSDILLCVQGGEKPHVGCIVQAVPRESLTGDGTLSATSSIINVTGHKDEFLCRELAEQVCQSSGAVVVCTGGFHMDGITKEQIREVLEAVKEVGGWIGEELGDVRRR